MTRDESGNETGGAVDESGASQSAKRARADVERLLSDPGFRPGARHVAALVALLDDEGASEQAERALGRMGETLAPALAERGGAASWTERQKVHVARSLARAGAAAEAADLLIGLLDDAVERPRRAAATALGKLAKVASPALRGRFEAALAPRLASAVSDAERRAVGEALGKVGGRAAQAALAAEAARATDRGQGAPPAVVRARLALEREARRREGGVVRGDVAPPSPLTVELSCRAGLEELLVRELPASARPTVLRRGSVQVAWGAPLGELFVARTFDRMAVRLADERSPSLAPTAPPFDEAMTELVVAVMRRAEPLLATLTEGPLRFRVAWARGGHRRALAWRVAEAINGLAGSRLVNDPTASLWELVVDERGPRTRFALVPRGLPDPRFSYRTRDVPAASHPTVAAALALAAAARAGDVVWDPFVGSGLELIECARRGAQSLFGTDTDDAALAAASLNLAAAGYAATLTKADALAYRPPVAPTLILSNPPMGLRVHRTAGLADLLDAFVAHAAEVLAPRGRLVWLSPFGERTRRAAERAGLVAERLGSLDLGGFDVEWQAARRA